MQITMPMKPLGNEWRVIFAVSSLAADHQVTHLCLDFVHTLILSRVVIIVRDTNSFGVSGARCEVHALLGFQFGSFFPVFLIRVPCKYCHNKNSH
jgi:hypothetical protein